MESEEVKTQINDNARYSGGCLGDHVPRHERDNPAANIGGGEHQSSLKALRAFTRSPILSGESGSRLFLCLRGADNGLAQTVLLLILRRPALIHPRRESSRCSLVWLPYRSCNSSLHCLQDPVKVHGRDMMDGTGTRTACPTWTLPCGLSLSTRTMSPWRGARAGQARRTVSSTTSRCPFRPSSSRSSTFQWLIGGEKGV